MLLIKRFVDIKANEKEEVLEIISSIFFENSLKKSFDNEESKGLFKRKWLLQYLDNYPELVFIAFDEDRPIGYLTGCIDSKNEREKLNIEGLDLFHIELDDYPAHLHLNIDSHFQGRGVGRKLINYFSDYLTKSKIEGLHIITSKEAENVRFYERLGFELISSKDFRGIDLLFMGKKIKVTSY